MTTDKPKCCEDPQNASPHKCPHLAAFKQSGGLEAFAVIQQYIYSAKMGIMKLPKPKCSVCNDFGGRLHACLQCVYFACWSRGHLAAHFKETNHFLAVDVLHHEIYCNQCKDYVYDDKLDQIVQIESRNSAERQSMLLEPHHTTYHPWEATKDELKTLEKNSNPVNVPSHILGLRGLINLGNTCFMNCILQSFVHNPLMRNYFLSDRHNSKLCTKQRKRNAKREEREQNSQNQQLLESKADICLGCEMDVLFEQIFSGSKTPYTPHHILYSIWKFANYFAGYEQQDAHEFLISSLNGLHTHLERPLTPNSVNTSQDEDSRDSDRCNCIVHTIFKGILRSELTCTACGFTSVTEDPFFDISLDIPKPSHPPPSIPAEQPPTTTPPSPPSPPSSPKVGTKRRADEVDNPLASPPTRSPVSLLSPIPTASIPSSMSSPVNTSATPITIGDCLDRFTQPERLGADEKFYCSKCHTRQESIKQLSMKSLPVVKICFHLKRFEQLAGTRHSNKIDTFIEFPSVLDMSPYISPNIKNNDKKDGLEETSKNEEESFSYQLFAVVNHQGKMDTGHYTCFVRHEDTWYKCDDATITVATLPSVLHSKGYLLFYMKHHLRYTADSLDQNGNEDDDEANSSS